MNKITHLLYSLSFIGFLSLTSCSKSNGQVDLRSDVIRDFVNCKSEKEICKMLLTATTSDEQDLYVPVTGHYNYDGIKYEIEFSEDKDYTDSYKLESFDDPIPTYGLIPGRTYYYRINDFDDPGHYIKTGQIKTKRTPGTFYTIDGMHNVRDLGGWKAENGKTIKFDKIIRGGIPNYYGDTPIYTSDGYEIISHSLKLKGEIDLRHSGDDHGQTRNIFSEEYPYLRASLSVDSEILPFFEQSEPVARRYNSKTPSTIKSIFSFLADESNYPLYVHCNAGADRTGTICMIIEGLLGVSVNDIYKDFELTSFSVYGKRWRSDIDRDNLLFHEDGVMQDDMNNYVAMGKCVETLWKTYAPKGTYQEAVANYLKIVCNVTDEEINTLKSIVLE